MASDFRLPLDLLLIKDVEELEDALRCKYAIEHESDIEFCKSDEDLQDILEDYEDTKYYEIDEIEHDRIKAVIDILNMAETNDILDHLLDRMVR
jgi:hypothetical protein